MIENISAKDLILKVIKWRRTFMWITIISTLIAGVLVFLMPKQYKSTTILFPVRQFSVSKLVIEANAGNQEDYMNIGDADDCERLIQTLSSDGLKLKVADAFNLWKRWKITDTMYAYHYLKLKWEEMVTIKRTEYNSIRVEVYDYTANGAAELANAIADYSDTIRAEMNHRISSHILKIVKIELDSTLARMKVLEDSLHTLRQHGVLQFKEQVKAYSKSYARAIEKNDVGAMKRLESKLDTLKKYGSAYQNIHDNLDKYSSKYPDIKMKYDEAMVNNTSSIPNKFVIEKAMPNEYKAKPQRLTLLAITILTANLMGLFYLLFREKFSEPKG
ncbi:Wzz/FepE/Etk N-terminal domain-containing protein [Aurantibacillus circumpalustris]|uniref:Wzz/FepE/Etk N-terminal domain-containing protein n=1 Tax=Aurantibacillus circumpalustris TaxID=3036359 RepID=UPI00295ACF29|nr:Wzz/FepE/Etk N-terminal domain-containing protein [Aurantibacillus circumpalustris]